MPADYSEKNRPDPEALLAVASKAGRGRLKVFLGMARAWARPTRCCAPPDVARPTARTC